MKLRIKFLILLLAALVLNTKAEVTINGTILDEQDNEIPFVTVWIEQDQVGTISGLDGRYEIVASSEKKINLSFHCIGMEIENQSIHTLDHEDVILDVVMKSKVVWLEEACVIFETSKSVPSGCEITIYDDCFGKYNGFESKTTSFDTSVEEESKSDLDEIWKDHDYVMKVYPNPVVRSQQLTLEIENYSKYASRILVSVIDISGKVIINYDFLPKGLIFKETIDFTHEVSSGTYIIEVNDGMRKICERVIVKD